LALFDIRLVCHKVRLQGEVTDKDINVVQPDLMVMCDYENEIDELDRYQGTPALAVKILPLSSRSMDRICKLDLYLNGGLAEFWLVDAAKRTVCVYSFADNELVSETIYTAGVPRNRSASLGSGLLFLRSWADDKGLFHVGRLHPFPHGGK